MSQNVSNPHVKMETSFLHNESPFVLYLDIRKLLPLPTQNFILSPLSRIIISSGKQRLQSSLFLMI